MDNLHLVEDAYPGIERWTFDNLDALLKRVGRRVEGWKTCGDSQEQNSVYHHRSNCTVYVKYHGGMKRLALMVTGNEDTAKRLFRNLETRIGSLNKKYVAPPAKS